MKKSNIRKNYVTYEKWLVKFERLLKDILEKYGKLSENDKRILVEAIFLRLCANWEYFIENQIIACANINSVHLSDFVGYSLPRHPPRNVCQAIIFNRQFRPFRGTEDLMGFTGKLFPSGFNPFKKISLAHRKKIDEAYKMRNYISHLSSFSRRQLKDMYRKNYRMKRFSEPGKFLLASKSKRLWSYMLAFKNAVNDMKKSK